MTEVSPPYTPHPAKTFFAVFLSGAFLVGLFNMGRDGSNAEISRIISGSNTAGVFLASIVAAASAGWKFPIFAKVALVHIVTAAAFGFLSYGSRGFASALGGSIPFALMYAIPCWLMLSRDWLVGRIAFWALAALFALGLVMIAVQ
jgi:hypothetical protein